jgi:hypothetical protein
MAYQPDNYPAEPLWFLIGAGVFAAAIALVCASVAWQAPALGYPLGALAVGFATLVRLYTYRR